MGSILIHSLIAILPKVFSKLNLNSIFLFIVLLIVLLIILYSILAHILVKPTNFLAKILIGDELKNEPFISINNRHILTYFTPFILLGTVFLMLVVVYAYLILFISKSFEDLCKFIAFENIKYFKLSINPKDVINPKDL